MHTVLINSFKWKKTPEIVDKIIMLLQKKESFNYFNKTCQILISLKKGLKENKFIYIWSTA